MNTPIIRFLFGTTIALMIAMLLLIIPTPTPVHALAVHNEINVNTTADEFDSPSNGACSLREAIKTANGNVNFGGCQLNLVSGVGVTTILVPTGTYTLTRTGAGEDADSTGDLDITNTVSIAATGAVTVTGNTNWKDRIFHLVTGALTITGITIRGGNVSTNTLSSGGGIFADGSLLLDNVTVISNSAGYGGGIYVYQGSAMLTNVTLDNNASSSDGAGIFNHSGLVLNKVTLTGNLASGNGGGIANDLSATTTFTNVTLSGNTALGDGGGIYNNGAVTLYNVTLSNNASTFGDGDGIFNGGAATLMNTIVTKSPAGFNCAGSVGGGFNLSNDNSCSFGAGRDNVTVKLGPLADNGGPTLTFIPLPGSRAIDFGTNSGCPATDQRGAHRPIGKACDVGAVETGYLFLPLILR